MFACKRCGFLLSDYLFKLVCRNVIQRLISLGFYYRELDHFATISRNLSFIQSTKDFSLPHSPELLKGKPRKGSVYRRAIANGIVEILSVYRAAVLQVEQNLLSDPLPILATVTQGLNKVSCSFEIGKLTSFI